MVMVFFSFGMKLVIVKNCFVSPTMQIDFFQTRIIYSFTDGGTVAVEIETCTCSYKGKKRLIGRHLKLF